MAVSFFPPLVIIFFKNSTQVTLCANMREKHGLFFFCFFFIFSHCLMQAQHTSYLALALFSSSVADSAYISSAPTRCSSI